MNRHYYYGPRTNTKPKPREKGEIGSPVDRFALWTCGLRKIDFCAAALSSHANYLF
jgi:hypothetical protein